MYTKQNSAENAAIDRTAAKNIRAYAAQHGIDRVIADKRQLIDSVAAQFPDIHLSRISARVERVWRSVINVK